jgi:D-sedoheptulose 7-phosphate isomerase
MIYARLIKGIGKKEISGRAIYFRKLREYYQSFEIAREKGIYTVGFTGDTGGKMKELSDYLINCSIERYPRIQESHIMLGHIICQLVEERYFALFT